MVWVSAWAEASHLVFTSSILTQNTYHRRDSATFHLLSITPNFNPVVLMRKPSSFLSKGFLLLFVGASAIIYVRLLFFAFDGSASASRQEQQQATNLQVKSNYKQVAAGVEGFEKERVNGWNPIHVYYGEVELDENPADSHSQVHQDEIILTLMAKTPQLDKRRSQQGGGKDDNDIHRTAAHFFIDLAANDSKYLSNTLRLENNGWDGLCIEPNPSYWYNLAHRSCTVVATFVGGVEDKVPVQARFDNGVFGGIVGETMDNTKEGGGTIVNRYTVSLLAVFRKFHVPKLMSRVQNLWS